MNVEVMERIAAGLLPVAAVHHLVAGVIAVIYWVRPRSMERVVGWHLAAAFATTAFAAWPHPSARWVTVVAAVLTALWAREAARGRHRLDLRRTPRPRLVVMGAAALFALVYPGYAGELPSFLFSPLGVLLPPTLILALAVVNAASPAVDRSIHWTLAVVGGAVGGAGLASEGVVHVPLIVVAVYAVPLLLGKGRTVEGANATGGATVRQIRNRMYSRKTLLPGPREPRRRRFTIRKS
jgi:hypothetical protein